LAAWSAAAIDNVEDLAREWIQQQIKEAAGNIFSCGSSLPLLFLAVVLGGRRRFGKTIPK
jgi:uncharacterized protein (TIGR03382 family)